MGLFNRKENKIEVREIPENNETLSDVLLSCFLNGETLTREKVLTIPSVSSNIDLISNSIATMPIKLYKRVGDKVEEVKGDYRTVLLNGDTSDTLDAYQLKSALVSDYFLGNGGYCYIKRNGNKVIGLFYVNSEQVTVTNNYNPIYKDYRVMVQGATYRPYDFIKLLRHTKDGATGTSIVKELTTALETAYQTQVYQLSQVKTGGNKKGFLKSERRLGKDEIDALKNAWRRLYTNNTDNVVVLNNGIDFKEATNTSVEMQLNESIKTLGEQIDKIFHIEKTFEETYKLAVYPIVIALETALNRDLLLETEKGTYFFKLDDKEIIKASLKERFETYKIAKETGLLTTNELRRLENLNDLDGCNTLNVGLSAVLYDIDTQKYFVPNTNSIVDTKTDNTNEE